VDVNEVMRVPVFSLQLIVEDIGTTEAFYGGILELAVSRTIAAPGAPDMLVVRQGDSELVFAEESAIVREHPLLEERFASFPKGVGVLLRFAVTGLEEISDAFDDEGIEILYPLSQQRYGGKELWCFDPDGYLVVLEEAIHKG
jgi:hypothetical protein